jgi:predicted nucleotidyltransferase component of viral defense system
MGEKTILTANQAALLRALGQLPIIREQFYLSDGTALAAYYLHHRFSEDLDFFSEEEVDSQGIFVILKNLPENIGIKKIDSEQSFNRNLFFLHLDHDVIKTEFTFYPFPRIENGTVENGIVIDSIMDIATNKLFTMYQKPRARDFIDLYLIIQKQKYAIADLIKKAKVKFDWHVDPLQLGAQFLQATAVKDYPRMITALEPDEWQDFFFAEAKKLGKLVL